MEVLENVLLSGENGSGHIGVEGDLKHTDVINGTIHEQWTNKLVNFEQAPTV